MNKKNYYLILALLIIGIIALVSFWYSQKKTVNSTDLNSSNNYASAVEAGLVGSSILGSATDNSITLNTLAEKGMAAIVEYGTKSGTYEAKTESQISNGGEPIVSILTGLKANTKYFYRLSYKKPSDQHFTNNNEYSFYTKRSAGSTFSFGVQGDSHPERTGKMFNSDLYTTTMKNAYSHEPDLYFTLGDDFSIENLIAKNDHNQTDFDQVYLNQRKYLDIIGSIASVNLVNGNHEQEAKYLLDGSVSSFPVLAAKARNNFFPLSAPSSFYSGDSQKIENIGNLKDYNAFEWGDALFVTIDPYWHSDVAVDNSVNSDKKNRDLWNNTLGDEQYQWFKKTLESSRAKYKFVFTHHVLGTGRGGVENAKLYEWGGYNQNGTWEFDKKRPGWELPIHQLMVKNDVTIFFQGHDHLFAKQELDGIIYQEVPNPADDTYTAFNQDAYKSGVTLPNSGYLNVTVSSNEVKVDYIKSILSKDENNSDKNNSINFSYTVKK